MLDTSSHPVPLWQQIWLVFAACAVPIYSWSLVALFEKLPSWLLHQSVWELVASLSYTLLVAFFESLVILLGLVLVSVLLPRRLFRDRFVAQGSTLALLGSLWAIVLQLVIHEGPSLSIQRLVLWSIPCLAAMGVLYFLIQRHTRVEEAVQSLAKRLSVLAFAYVFLTAISAVIVLLRNI